MSADDDGADDETVVVAAGPEFARRRVLARVRRRRPLILVVSGVVVVLVLAWLVLFSSVLTVKGVEVSGNSALSSSRIIKAAGVPDGEQLVHVDLSAIQARVKGAFPAISEVSVSRSWPHSIRIEVSERVPVAVVERAGELQSVDIEGVLFGSYRRAPADLPLIRTQPDVTASALAEAAQIVTLLRPDIAADVEHLDVESIDRITLALTGGVKVVWGTADSSQEKAEVLAILLGKAGKDVKEIDVSVPARPTSR